MYGMVPQNELYTPSMPSPNERIDDHEDEGEDGDTGEDIPFGYEEHP
jgi:hypothetical protein